MISYNAVKVLCLGRGWPEGSGVENPLNHGWRCVAHNSISDIIS